MRKNRRIVIYLFVLALLAGMSVIWILGRKAERILIPQNRVYEYAYLEYRDTPH